MSTPRRAVPTPDSTVTRQTFRAHFACLSCAESAEPSLRAQVGIIDVDVQYAGGAVDVEYRPDVIDATTIEQLIAQSAYDCYCSADHGMTHRGGGLTSLAHKADMATVTEGTTADRMQYEFPATRAGTKPT